MKRAMLVLLAAVLCPAAHAQDKALLYEISGNGLGEPSYLFGTFHIVCPTDLQLTDATRNALTEAEQLYLELDLDDPALEVAMVRAMMLGGGQNIGDFLTPGDYTALDTYMQENLGAGLAQMGILKPVGLMAVMVMTVLDCQPASYDQTFAQMAGQEGKEVLGLETVEEQIALFDRIPIDEQLKGLVDIARRPDEAQEEIAKLIAAYKAQDLTLLMNLISQSEFDGGMDGFREELLDQRNIHWIPVIEKAAREKSTFFAFGAAHLGGANGVVPLLEQRGYTVKAVQ